MQIPRTIRIRLDLLPKPTRIDVSPGARQQLPALHHAPDRLGKDLQEIELPRGRPARCEGGAARSTLVGWARTRASSSLGLNGLLT